MGETKVAPPTFYYALIDGTSAVDSVAFGKGFKDYPSWRNVLDLLERDPKDKARLVDPNHDFLPIYKISGGGSKSKGGVAVLCPAGLGGLGKDDMWQGYGGADGIEFPDLKGTPGEHLWGRHAAAERAAGFVSAFFVRPTVRVIDKKGYILTAPAVRIKGTSHTASFLYVSSHGWLGGFSRGDMSAEHPGALPVPTSSLFPPTARYLPQQAYFAIGKIDAKGKSFAGPEWIVLAQCSTLNANTWSMWARVMARSSPQVRGVLGYEESSPEALSSVPIAESFFTGLKANKTFYEAWIDANPGKNWAALVHKDAMKDTLFDWASRPTLKGSSVSDYLGSASKAPAQAPVEDPKPPYIVDLFHVKTTMFASDAESEITPAVLDEAPASLMGWDKYRVEIEIPGETISRATIEWIHIRDTFKTQIKRSDVFPDVEDKSNASAVFDLTDPKVVAVTYSPPVKRAAITFTARLHSKLAESGLEPHHSYLWPRVHVTGGGLTDELQDVKTKGLVYLG